LGDFSCECAVEFSCVSSHGLTLDHAESRCTVVCLEVAKIVKAKSGGSHDRQKCNYSATSYRARWPR
jgi:hypothetical protein